MSTSRDGTVTLWDAGTLIPRETLRGHSDSVWQPAFSPDGKTLYTASADGTTIAWDVSGERWFGRRLHLHGRPRRLGNGRTGTRGDSARTGG